MKYNEKYFGDPGIKPLISCSSDCHSNNWAVVALIHNLQKKIKYNRRPWTSIDRRSCSMNLLEIIWLIWDNSVAALSVDGGKEQVKAFLMILSRNVRFS